VGRDPEVDELTARPTPRVEGKTGPSVARARDEAARARDVGETGAGQELAGGAAGYQVSLPAFQGPLDLLLHLIQKHELDILDIPIAFITEQYVAYITMLKDLSIDIASEYMVMAATLAHIKSRMLLPAPPADDSEESSEFEEDPRSELVKRLLEYQKYKQAAESLAQNSVFGRDVFARGAVLENVQGQAPLAPVSLFQLLDAFQRILERAKQLEDHPIDFERISITERINQISDVLQQRQVVPFSELFADDQTKGDLILTFLALLEMTRLRLTELLQESPLAEISVRLRVWGEDEPPSPKEADDEAQLERAEQEE
jgi:segregation and condensation protein A